MTLAQIQAHVAESWENGLDYLVQNNPLAAYNLIKKLYTTDFPETWIQGTEQQDGAQQKMSDFLYNRAMFSADPKQFVATLALYIPYNPYQKTESGQLSWTVYDTVQRTGL